MKIFSHINPEYSEKLKPLFDTLAKGKIPANAWCVFQGRNRIFRIKYEGVDYCIKAFRKPKSVNSVIYHNLRKSKAVRSYLYAEKLLRRGIDTPRPVGWLERIKGVTLKESYYVSLFSPYANNLRDWEKWDAERQEKVLQAYARHLFAIHQAGILHRDLSAGNVLWDIDKESGEVRFDIIDLNRMRLFDRPLTPNQSWTNFRNINLNETETERLGALYGKECGINPETAGKKALRALRKDQLRKKRLHTVKKFFKKSLP